MTPYGPCQTMSHSRDGFSVWTSPQIVPGALPTAECRVKARAPSLSSLICGPLQQNACYGLPHSQFVPSACNFKYDDLQSNLATEITLVGVGYSCLHSHSPSELPGMTASRAVQNQESVQICTRRANSSGVITMLDTSRLFSFDLKSTR